MSTIEKLKGRDPAPSVIRYLVFVGAFTSILTALAFFPQIPGSSTQESEFYNGAIEAFFIIGVISFVEWFLLRYSRKIIGPYGFAFGVEFLKSILLNMGASFYVQTVSDASSSTFLLPQLISMSTIFLLALTKLARSKIESLAERDLARNTLNLLPTILVIILFMSTYVTEITGLGTPRQRSTFENYTDKDIDWSMFNTPTWDATYLLENLLDQFTAGLSAPDTPLFNVTSDQSDHQDPIVYWRLGSLSQYEFTGKPPYTTDWNPVSTFKRVISPTAEGTPFSQDVPSNERTAQFTVKLPLDYNTSTADFSVNPSFKNFLPVTWNGEYGSFVDATSFSFLDSEENPLTTQKAQTREILTGSFSSDIRGVDANVQLVETSSNKGYFTYTMNYKSPDIQTAAAFSLTRSAYSNILDSDSWSGLQNTYLQLPDLPSQIYVDGNIITPSPSDNYSVWAPTVSNLARQWNLTDQTVFGQAYHVMQELGNQDNFTFDQDMWLGQQALGQEMAHPAEYEDYNEWFMSRGKGVSLHFASAFATIMRLQKIPSRVVIGYIGGNDSVEYDPWRVITSRFLHAWAEVLVPIDPNPILPGDERLEWVSFDPLLSYFASQYGIDMPTDIIPPTTVSNQTTRFIRWDYDLETKGLSVAIAEHIASPSDWIFDRCTVNNGSLGNNANIVDGTPITLATRLVKMPSLATWLPYSGVNISFYVGTTGDNTTGIETSGFFVGSAVTDSQGYVKIDFAYNATLHGIRQVNFYAIFKDEDTNTYRLAISFTYNLVLF
ncbi:MAG: transglutaminase-like domain-containing protein [Candidatus Hodarchaeales archaeon]